MFLQRLELRNFRNFDSEVVEFPEEGAALIGDNGQGKTNLLEAIYYLEIFRSFRGARDEQLLCFGRDYFRVEGSLLDSERERTTEVAAAFMRDGRRKKVSVNGQEPVRLGEAIGRIGAIIFTASDVDIVIGGPGVRRRFLDIVLSLAKPGYLSVLQRYRQILSQRNGLLRDGARPVELSAWNDGLVETGAQICLTRAGWVAASRESFSRYYKAISGGQEATLEYRPAVGAGGPFASETAAADSWRNAFLAGLERLAERERRRGLTLVGPHRDDLGLRMRDDSDSVTLRSFGSAGQQRTAAVALRMVEAETLRAGGRRPIVMLDDVFAEFDPSRAERVVELLTAEEWGQVIVTSPKPDELAVMGDALPEYRVADGRVRRA